MKKWIVILLLGNCALRVLAQQPARISEVKKRYTTYSFSDPDPIASAQKLYPYFRFDGFTNTAIEKEWKTVILENDYIRVQVMPEIGGKIWSAYDKVGKRDYIYNNGVVKFRDIAMRDLGQAVVLKRIMELLVIPQYIYSRGLSVTRACRWQR
nr:DUF5107 domain-containing protein [Sphingobacterium sp. E70]